MLRYFKTWEFWITLLVLLLLTVGGFFALFYAFLPIYTRHNDSVVVPDLSGLNVEEAKTALEDAGLRYEIADSAFIAGYEPLEIIRQDPAGLKTVKPERRIYLTVNRQVPPRVKFPEVRNVSNYQAKLRLESWGLSIDTIRYIPSEFRNLVMFAEFEGEKLKTGSEIPVGTRVTLVVGKGKGTQRVGIPKLEGMPYDNAISVLHELGLNVGSLRFRKDAEEPKGTVIKQYPRYTVLDSLTLGESVDLEIAGKRPEEGVEGVILEDE